MADEGQSVSPVNLADRRNSFEVTQSKLLTLIVTGRNDEYMGNFKYRITTCLNYVAHHLSKLGRLEDVELMVTDWNSEVPLARVLALSPEARRICRFVCVPPSIAQTVQSPGEVFYPTCADNTALRRAQGEFLVLFDADSLIPCQSLQNLLDLLDGKIRVPYRLDQVFMFGDRYQVPWETVQREPSLEDWDRYFLLNSGQLPPDVKSYGLGIFGAAQMMHRSIWYACRGYNQQLRISGWLDAELTLRVTQLYPWVNLASFGISLFHMEHWPKGRRTFGVQAHNLHHVSSTFAVNDENWGLGDYDLDVQSAEAVAAPLPGEGAKGSAEAGATQTASSVEPWSQTREELLAELTAPQIRRHLRKTVYAPRVKPTEWGSLHALAWYCLHHYPRTYLEFGVRDGYAAAMVAAACPGIEIYGIDSWRPGADHRPVPPPSYTAAILEEAGYRGYVRFVSGEVGTAFRRLRDSFIGPLALDLILIRGDLLGTEIVSQLGDLAQHLAPGGALVFTCVSRTMFEAAWAEMRAKFPQLTYWQCKDRHTGLALAALLQKNGQGDGLGKSSVTEEAELAAAWRGWRLSQASLSIWKRRLKSVWDQVESQPLQRWPRTLWRRWGEFRRRWQKDGGIDN